MKYIFNFYFEEILNIQYEITSDFAKFEASKKPRLNYSQKEIINTLTIKPHALLSETGIKKQEIRVTLWNRSSIFFQNNKTSEIPFDLFAAGFYLLTRYEEYLPFTPDKHGRFPAEESFAYKNNFLDQPIIDQWAFQLLNILKKHYPNFTTADRKFNYIPTIDIDVAYAYKHKGFIRTAGALTKALLTTNFNDIKQRIKVLKGIQKDPYDTFDLFDILHSKYKLSPVFFFLTGKYAHYDKNLSLKKKAYQELIMKTSKKSKIGIHPSYYSSKSFKILQNETETFYKFVKKQTKRSRQHYLKFTLPITYRNLIKLNIKEDYSMGFASLPGFRAGTCTPHNFFDLENNEQTTLKLYPFQVMDGTLNEYMRLDKQEALSQIEELVNSVKLVNGTFISLWHNQSLSEQNNWKEWSDYEEMLKICKL
nr:polysaccharide deacetylase family protein [uncultured Draconibacterium sp.]